MSTSVILETTRPGDLIFTNTERGCATLCMTGANQYQGTRKFKARFETFGFPYCSGPVMYGLEMTIIVY